MAFPDASAYRRWAQVRDAQSRCALSGLLVHGYRVRLLRPCIRRLALHLEGGRFFTRTLRDIYARYYRVTIGRYSYGGVFIPGLLPPGTRVGNYASVASILAIYRRNHPTERVSQHPLFYNSTHTTLDDDTIDSICSNPLVLGHDSWVGRHTVILPGCNEIGDGAIVGAGSVVTRDVEPFTIVAGNPARVIRRRFSATLESRIRASRWWLHPLHVMADILPCFTATADEQLIALLDQLPPIESGS